MRGELWIKIKLFEINVIIVEYSSVKAEIIIFIISPNLLIAYFAHLLHGVSPASNASSNEIP